MVINLVTPQQHFQPLGRFAQAHTPTRIHTDISSCLTVSQVRWWLVARRIWTGLNPKKSEGCTLSHTYTQGTPTHREAILLHTRCFNGWCGAAATASCHMPSLVYSLRVVLCASRMHVCGLLLTWSHDCHMTPHPQVLEVLPSRKPPSCGTKPVAKLTTMQWCG